MCAFVTSLFYLHMGSLLSEGLYTGVFRRQHGQSSYYHPFVHSFEINISQKKKTTKLSICICFCNDAAWDLNDACGQSWTLNKIPSGSCKRHTCRMGYVGVGDGPVTTTGTPQDRSDGCNKSVIRMYP